MSGKNVDCRGHAVKAGNRVTMRLPVGMDVAGKVEFIVNGQATIRDDRGLLFSRPLRFVTFVGDDLAKSPNSEGE